MIKFIKDLIEIRNSYKEHQIELYKKAKSIIINGDIEISLDKKVATYKEDRVCLWFGVFEPSTSCYVNGEEICDVKAIKKLMRLMSDIYMYKKKEQQ